MNTLSQVVVAYALYACLGRFLLSKLNSPWKERFFCCLNISTCVLVYCWVTEYDTMSSLYFSYIFTAYVLFASLLYVCLCKSAHQKMSWAWPFAVAIIFLAIVKYVPGPLNPVSYLLLLPIPVTGKFVSAAAWIGISFFTFRMCRLFLDVRNKQVALPTYSGFLSYAFFVPVMLVGPITSYQHFSSDLKKIQKIPFLPALTKVMAGALKFVVLANLLKTLTYSRLILDGHAHHFGDLCVAMVAYYFYLYCNFSGVCDMAIGLAALMGIRVDENFDNPFAARNVKDFWNRWHITLTHFVRDTVFTPLSKWMIQNVSSRSFNHILALNIFLVFILIGIWHGAGWNFLLFGVFHALGVTTHHYYALFLKKNLSKEAQKRYATSFWIRVLAVSVTFVYVSVSFFFFANDLTDMKSIFDALVFRMS